MKTMKRKKEKTIRKIYSFLFVGSKLNHSNYLYFAKLSCYRLKTENCFITLNVKS